MGTVLYFAYGSNMNPEQMAFRCPGARKVGPFKLPNWRLVFRMVADIEKHDGAEVQGMLWEINADDERALDIFEGVDGGVYSKEYFSVMTPEGEREVLTYLMNSDGVFPPTEAYYLRIVGGYRAAGLKFKLLREAKDRAWDERNPSYRERRRYGAAGRPRLAQRSAIDAPAPAAAPVHGNLKPPKQDKRTAQALPSNPANGDRVDDLWQEPVKASRKAHQPAPRQNLSDWLEERRATGRGY